MSRLARAPGVWHNGRGSRVMAPDGSSRARRWAAAGLGGWLLLLLCASSPHLVHHAFDADSHDDCAYLAADAVPAALAAQPALPVQAVARYRGPAVRPGRARVPSRAAGARAPPAASLARA